MFAIVQNGIIKKLVEPTAGFELDGNFYPANWCQLASAEEKASIGMVEVVYGPRDSEEYYWITNEAPVYNAQTNQVVVLFTKQAKDLDSLKASSVSKVHNIVNGSLSSSDWMIVKAMETNTTVPTAWSTYRQAVRATGNSATAAIAGVTNVEELIAVMQNIDWPQSPDAELRQGV